METRGQKMRHAGELEVEKLKSVRENESGRLPGILRRSIAVSRAEGIPSEGAPNNITAYVMRL